MAVVAWSLVAFPFWALPEVEAQPLRPVESVAAPGRMNFSAISGSLEQTNCRPQSRKTVCQ